jgi:hypothetical protein
VSQNWLRVFSCSIFRSAFSKFLLLFVAWFSALLLSCSSFLMTTDPFYIFFFRNDWIDVWCCSFKPFSFTVCPLLHDLYNLWGHYNKWHYRRFHLKISHGCHIGNVSGTDTCILSSVWVCRLVLEQKNMVAICLMTWFCANLFSKRPFRSPSFLKKEKGLLCHCVVSYMSPISVFE